MSCSCLCDKRNFFAFIASLLHAAEEGAESFKVETRKGYDHRSGLQQSGLACQENKVRGLIEIGHARLRLGQARLKQASRYYMTREQKEKALMGKRWFPEMEEIDGKQPQVPMDTSTESYNDWIRQVLVNAMPLDYLEDPKSKQRRLTKQEQTGEAGTEHMLRQKKKRRRYTQPRESGLNGLRDIGSPLIPFAPLSLHIVPRPYLARPVSRPDVPHHWQGHGGEKGR